MRWFVSLYIGGFWIRLPKELNMKRLLGLLPLFLSRTSTNQSRRYCNVK
jgi:hypothetical protein